MTHSDDAAPEERDEPAASMDAGLAEAVRFQRDLYLYWRASRAVDGLPLTTRGYVSRPALRRIRERLAVLDGVPLPETDIAEGDASRFFFLRRMLERLGLLRQMAAPACLVAADEGEMLRYLAHPLAERLRICVRVWVAGGWWPDRLDPRMAPAGIMTPAPPRLALARRRIVAALTDMRLDARAQLPAAATGTPARKPPAPTGQKRASSREWIASAGDSDTWRAALLGPLAWMGLVVLDTSLAATTARGPETYAAGTPTAALRSEPEALLLGERPGRVVIQPNFSVIAYPPLTAPELLGFDLCADETAAGQIAQYRLSRTAFTRARAAGWTVEQLAARLEALTGTALPANVRVSLDDWERHVERVRLTPDATLLDVRDAALLDALLADRSAAAWIARRLTPTAALITPSNAERVRSWLLTRGALPAVIRLTPTTAD